MSECYGRYFIKNGKVYDREAFDDSVIKTGKSIYEVVRIIDGVPLFLEKHLERMSNSADLVKCKMLMNYESIRDNMRRLINEEGNNHGNVKIVFNYGESDSSYFYFFKHSYPEAELYKKGVHTILYHGERENPNAKVVNSAFKERVEALIRENDAYEAILVDREGYITEGSKSNIFMILKDKVITSPVEAVLPGVTRNIIINLIKGAGIDFAEEKFHYSSIASLQGLFISGTSPKVLPISTVNNYHFASGSNEIIEKIIKLYDKEVSEYICKNKI
ncbi:MAG: aminotransferase class IV [Bacillota bacterium]|nr:aminotransferase class IV [Bacillota bacterium]